MKETLRRTGLGSTEVADALGKRGAIPNLFSVNLGSFVVGHVFPVYAACGTNWHFHKQIEQAPKDSIVYVHNHGCGDKAILGGLVADFLFKHREVCGLVVNGFIRDVPHIKFRNYPVWCLGYNPIGCINTYIEVGQDIDLSDKHGIMVCDETGVVLIGENDYDLIMHKMHEIKEREQSWFDGLAEGKTTFEIVCKRD